MPVATLTGVPRCIEAGNDVIFLDTLTQYPAGTWTMQFVLSMGALAPVVTSATASGTNFLVTLAGSVTSTLAAGLWEWAMYVSNSGQRTTARNGTMMVLPNLAVTAAPSAAQTMLTALEATITALSSKASQSVSFNGQSFTNRDMKSLLEQRVQLQAEVLREKQAMARARGGPDRGRITTEFMPVEGGHIPFDQGWPYELR